MVRTRRNQQFLQLILELLRAGETVAVARAWHDHAALRSALNENESVDLPECPEVVTRRPAAESLARYTARYLAGRPNNVATLLRG